MSRPHGEEVCNSNPTTLHMNGFLCNNDLEALKECFPIWMLERTYMVYANLEKMFRISTIHELPDMPMQLSLRQVTWFLTLGFLPPDFGCNSPPDHMLVGVSG